MPEKKLCFVIGPIGEPDSEPRVHADWLLEGIIEPVIAGFSDFSVKRADQDPRPGLIDAQLINDLLNAELVIADLSFVNPNVYYEIGIRHMAQKPIIHMQLAIEKPPFDLSLYRAIKFSRSKYRDLAQAQGELRRAIEAVLADNYEIENPVTHARGKLKLDEHATTGQKIVLDQLGALDQRLADLEDQLTSPVPLQRDVRRREFESAFHIQMFLKLSENADARKFSSVERWIFNSFHGVSGIERNGLGVNVKITDDRPNRERARNIQDKKDFPPEISSVGFRFPGSSSLL